MKILGLAGALGHDASACLIVGDVVVAMAEEERFSRQRHAHEATPVASARYCLDAGGLALSEIDAVALGWDPCLAPYPVLKTFTTDWLGRMGAGRRSPPIIPVPHHLSHAASAFVSSGFDEAAILVVDGQGEDTSTSIGYGQGGRLRLDRTWPIGDSLGHLYRSVTRAIGFPPFAEGKVMGLSAYPSDGVFDFPIEFTAEGYRLAFEDGPPAAELLELERVIFRWLEARNLLLCNVADPDAGADGLRAIHENAAAVRLAASLQRSVERAVLHLAALAVRQAGVRRLVLAGGLALNCVANGRLLADGIVDELYVPPVANDAGTSLGAAQVVALEHGYRPRLDSVFLGPQTENAAIEAALLRAGASFRTCEDPAAAAAELLTQNKLLGWFQGSAEVGPRALGRRSTVALAGGGTAQRDRVNRAKGRELWRPLAPAISGAKAAQLFEPAALSPCMTLSGRATERGAEQLSAAVHIDGTSRAQVVAADDGPWSRLIVQVERHCGAPGVINTSLNSAGAPIVNTPEDALEAFRSSQLHALIIENYIIERP